MFIVSQRLRYFLTACREEIVLTACRKEANAPEAFEMQSCHLPRPNHSAVFADML